MTSLILTTNFQAYDRITGQNIDLTIDRHKYNFDGKIKFIAYINSVEVGALELDRVRAKKDGTFGTKTLQESLHSSSENMFYLHNCNFYPYGIKDKNNLQLNYIFIDSILSSQRERYKGVGTALMNCVFQLAEKNKYRGRVQLKATTNSKLFYEKIGFSSNSTNSYMYLNKTN